MPQLPANFDIDAALRAPSPTQMPGQSPTENPAPVAQAVQPSMKLPASFDINRVLNNGMATDPTTGQDIPLAYSGNTPDTAMNKNGLTAVDKMNMAFGTKDGNIAYLKEKFPNAQEIKGSDGKPTGELAYQQGNTWYRVDPNTGDTPDPWKKTKEYIDQATDMKNIAAKAPMALGTAIAAGMGIATEGLSLPASAMIAGGVAAATRTSLGRLIGTYDATPGEQAWDIGFEGLLNAGLAKIAPGVKPTAKWIADKIPGLAEMFSDTVGTDASNWSTTTNPAKLLFKKVMASISTGEREFDTMAENPIQTKSTMQRLDATSGGSTTKYWDQAINEQTQEAGKAAGDSRNVLSGVYGTMRNKLLAKIPSNFSVNLEDSVYASYKSALEQGIGALKVNGKDLTGKEAIDYLAENGSQKAAFRLFSPDELQVAVNKGGAVGQGAGYLAANPEAHATVQSFYDQLGRFAGGADRTGVQGAKDILDFKKIATDLAQDATSNPAGGASFDVRNLINTAKSGVDNSVYQALKQSGAADDFANLNGTYSKLATDLNPFLKAQRLAISTGSDKPYGQLAASILAKPGPTSSAARGALDSAIDAASANGLDDLALSLQISKRNIHVLEAAKAFNPLKDAGQKASEQSLGGMLTAPFSGAGTAAAKASLATVQGLWQAKEALSSLPRKGIEELMNNPQALSKLTTGIIQAPSARMQADQAAQGVLQQLQGPSPQQAQQQQMQQQRQMPHGRYGR